MTAMAAALEAAGFRRCDMEAYSAAQRYIRNGGDRDGWIRLFDQAAEKLSGGRVPRAENGHLSSAARQPDGDDGGQNMIAAQAQGVAPPSSPPDREREGPSLGSNQGHKRLASPAREPSLGDNLDDIHEAGKRLLDATMAHGLVDRGEGGRFISGANVTQLEPTSSQRAAVARVAQDSARAVLTKLDTWRARDGRALGDVTWGDVENLRIQDAQWSALWRGIQKLVGSAASNATIRTLVTPAQVDAILSGIDRTCGRINQS